MSKYISWGRKLHDSYRKQRQLLGGSLYEYVFVGAIFFLLTLVLTNFTLLNGTHQLFIEGPGDGTAGFLWFNSVDTDLNPSLSHTDMANYPQGENLQNPTQITYSVVLMPLWLMSRLFGPIMGLNIITFFGFWSCAMVMYWLIRKLTKDPFVALFAAYAAAFIPYHLLKSSSHLTYIFSVVFVLMIAAFIGYWQRPSARRAILFACTIAVAFYTDGYFLLIGSIFAACLLLAGILYDLWCKKPKEHYFLRLKHAVIALGALIVLLIPIGVTQVTQASKVNGFLASARGSIAFDIEYYSTHLTDFLIPAPLNPFLKDEGWFQNIVAHQNRRSNGSENLMYIGWTVIVLVLVGLTMLATYIFKHKRNHLSKYKFIENYKLIFAVGLVSVPVLVLCMLSPSFTIYGISVPTLGDVLLHFNITLWRVLARFYLPLHVVFVVLAAFSMAALISRNRPKNLKSAFSSKSGVLYVAVVVVAIVVTVCEYASVNSRPSYEFNNIPKVYTWIKAKNDIRVIAELPLVDRPLSTNYDFATAQVIHGKKLINTPLTGNIPGGRTALGGGDSLEAIDYAINRGADTIITHNKLCSKNQMWGELVYVDVNTPQTRESVYYGSPICVYKVNSTYKTDELFAKLKFGTFSDAPYVDKETGSYYQMIYMADGWIDIADSLGKPVTGKANFTANIQTTPAAKPFKGVWTAYQAGQIVASGNIPGRISIDNIDASEPIRIHVNDVMGQTPNVFQVSLSDIVITKTTERED